MGIFLMILSTVMMQDQQQVAHIRGLRGESNRAIAEADLEALAASWSEGIQVTISSGAHLDGRAAYRAAFASVFANQPGTTFVRTPRTIRISEDGRVAAEQGDWTGTYPGQQIGSRTGEYLAYWRLIDGDWRITAELYVPLTANP